MNLLATIGGSVGHMVVSGLIRQPEFNEDPLEDKDGLEPSFLAKALLITPPVERAPSPTSLVRFRSFNAGAEVGAGRGFVAGLAVGVGIALVLRKVF